MSKDNYRKYCHWCPSAVEFTSEGVNCIESQCDVETVLGMDGYAQYEVRFLGEEERQT